MKCILDVGLMSGDMIYMKYMKCKKMLKVPARARRVREVPAHVSDEILDVGTKSLMSG